MIRLLEVRPPLHHPSWSDEWFGRCLWQCPERELAGPQEVNVKVEQAMESPTPGSSLVLGMRGRSWLLSRRSGQPGWSMSQLD